MVNDYPGLLSGVSPINEHIADMFQVHRKLLWFFICTMFIDIYVNFLEIYYRYELFGKFKNQECYFFMVR